VRTDAGAVVRRHGHFDAAEDAVQEALLAAAAEYRAAARTATSLPERRHLAARAARLAGTGGPARAAGTADSP
jgi:hypothetical protein